MIYSAAAFAWIAGIVIILLTVRRQARVMAAHRGQGPSTAQDQQSNKIQTSVIKTMILVCGLFAVTYAPVYVYSLSHLFHLEIMTGENDFFAILSITYLYTIFNPFIYASKFDPVKHVLLDLIPCKKNTQQAPQSAGSYN